ncbi:hypothetical protein HYG87_03805 [Methanobacterium alkalithermotolerans]|uniref:PepSY domain-containing protein n=1 Tax=Methanobacterium alkalithermotolerans TaxID=2731220 RepID=A0A8T8K4P3_9EURY|nr:hypothetical protein [Methanobacterium alkalithermotolerans]QUH22957.1 hypothetical protein HYG87_03805 [Methanobacterium alkalithermotolerans]RJS48227.1 MAG: hypothetical protein CIT03_09415 [Methanobacterium sp.]
MNTRNIIILLVLIVLVLGSLVAYLLIKDSGPVLNNNTINQTNNTTNTSPETPRTEESQENMISASEAQKIASNYMASSSNFNNLRAGNPSLKSGVYYVPMITIAEAQHAAGTMVGNVRVDAYSGKVLGIQSWNIDTGESIYE